MEMGPRLKSWPHWHLDGKASPTDRLTFITAENTGAKTIHYLNRVIAPVRLGSFG
jgi:hypothetical protein